MAGSLTADLLTPHGAERIAALLETAGPAKTRHSTDPAAAAAVAAQQPDKR